MSENKKNILYLLLLSVIVLAVGATLMTNAPTNPPDNTLIHKEYVIRGTGHYDQLYANEIYKDYGGQSFGMEVASNDSDVRIYTLSSITNGYQESQFSKWLVSYYGAKEITNEGK